MSEELASQWDRIREIVERGRRSTGHHAIASADADGSPTITPIGTIFLREDCTGFYFDQYTERLAENLDINPHVCVMAVDGGRAFWLRSLLTGRFRKAIGVRLYGTAGPRRPATPDELNEVHKRVRLMRATRGGRTLWSDFSHVRDLTFIAARLVQYPVMMPASR
ncbi:pyridoxamine 5'-phosphate oxidase family protein [Mycobacterium sp. DL440]|uniref:pyridoxamine 5'-phosphate oxidase family protein n=1 Tax=Mycobacterium sp. DL440 TaxID=2675523 RepID=UPI00141EBBF6|nr:pyridoxamine 5'-phosphate oxidase family protein [Mycobacterium sp. DL440]